MSLQTLLLIHVCCAIIAMISGYLAMALRKGSGLHRAAGSVFFVSMLLMGSTAAFVAFARVHMLNGLTSVLTLYLVITGWLAARRKEQKTGSIDVAALLVILAVAAALYNYGFEAAGSPTGSKDGYPAPLYFVFGSVALLHGISDIRMLVRGGVAGSRRIARHLWRISLALLLTTLSFYPGQPRLVAPWLRETNLIWVPHVLLIGSMLFWLVRVRGGRRAASRTADVAPAARPAAGERLAHGGLP